MRRPYTHKNVRDVVDSAAAFGFAETQESRFAGPDFHAEQTGFSHHTFKPGRRQAFGHRHGLEVLAFGALHASDRGEIIPGWWSA